MVAARPLAARAFMRWASDAACTAGVATVGTTGAGAGILGLEPKSPDMGALLQIGAVYHHEL